MGGLLNGIALLFVASALFRLGIDTSFAFAEAVSPKESSSPTSDEHDPGVLALVQKLKAREAELEARELDLLKRLKTAEAAEMAIRSKLEQLQTAEESLSRKIEIAAVGSDEDVARLTEVYARMKPKSAAALFSEMEPSFAAGFLGRMNPEAAAAILAGMEPDTAYTISVVLAGRNAGAIKE